MKVKRFCFACPALQKQAGNFLASRAFQVRKITKNPHMDILAQCRAEFKTFFVWATVSRLSEPAAASIKENLVADLLEHVVRIMNEVEGLFTGLELTLTLTLTVNPAAGEQIL